MQTNHHGGDVLSDQPKPKRKPKAKPQAVAAVTIDVEPETTPEATEIQETVEETAPEVVPAPDAGAEKAESFLQGVHEGIKARMAELEPFVKEYELLQNAEKALGGTPLKQPPGKPKARSLIR